MERARATWTDERLDDLARRIDLGFDRVDRELVNLSGRIDAQGAELAGRIDALSGRLDARIDALQRTMIQLGGGLVAAMLATLVTLIATQG
jgi:hypothetical protein